jgi:hypothetical protein
MRSSCVDRVRELVAPTGARTPATSRLPPT